MLTDDQLVEKLTALNHIAETLNRAVDVHGMLDDALADLVELMGLETAWISLKEPADEGGPGSGRWALTAHHNLPPALDLENSAAWHDVCTCQRLSNEGGLTAAYNEVHCSRLGTARGDRRELAVHASAPLRSGDRLLGILNVAAPDWASFSPQSLSLLTNVGNQMGVALERARLFDLLREQRGNEQQALLNLSGQLLSHLNLDDLIDYLVKEVRQILSADACAVLLPSEEPDSLEVRASAGWRLDPGASRRQVPGESSGLGRVMHTQEPLLVEDIQNLDPSRWEPGWLKEEGFRAHAVVPLLVEDRPIGILVISQRDPRQLHGDEVRVLRLMANQAAMAIDKARLHEEEVRMQALEKELAVAHQIQLSLLPDQHPVVPGWEFAAFYQAAREVGGDFYDIFPKFSDPERIGLVIADVTGKGVPAALFMARTCSTMRAFCLNGHSPASTLVQANEMILKNRRSPLLLSAFHGELDTHSGRLVYANAGHWPPYWLQASSGRVRELEGHGIILGALEEIELDQGAVDVAPGDYLVFYTDGVNEAMNASGEMFGEERLKAIIEANQGATAQALLDGIVDAVRAHTGEIAQSDDSTMFVVRRTPHTS
jgi:sigma-B regulation protein RsbU (phosphoserine phosphatase)